MIRTHEHDFADPLEVFLLRHGVEELPSETASTAIPAHVNHGRWVVACPFCPSAQLASDADPRFFCVGCRNEAVGGKWLPVSFPRNRQAIEEILMARPAAPTRNWMPGESLQDLARENAQRGV